MIGVSVASKREWESVKQYYNIDSCLNNPYGEYFFMTLGEKELVFYRSGARKVNSSGACQYMIDKFNLEKIIVIGTCAGIDDKYKKLDIFIPNIAAQYDCTIEGFEPFLKKQFIVNLKLPDINLFYNTGTIGTADKAVVLWSDYLKLKENNITVADVESAAISYVCKLNNIECVIVKGISDFPHHEDNKNTYDKQVMTFSNNVPLIMFNILENYLIELI